MARGEIRVGTSGWHYPGGAGTWNGTFYPKPRPRGFDELRFYAERFSTVEVNATFYRPPEAAMSRQWVDRTPDGFLFAVKLFQKFTHPDMFLTRRAGLGVAGRDAGAADWDITQGDIDQFRAGIEPIAAAGRLGALLVQFPSSFHATSDTRDYVTWLLAAFRGYPLAVEFRHASWRDDLVATRARLDDGRAALVEIDEPFAEFQGAGVSGSQSFRVSELQSFKASGLAYFRFHGRNKAQWWAHGRSEDRYNYLYSADEIAPFAAAAQAEAALEKRVLAYFNNHFSAKAVANADILKQQLGELLPAWSLRPPAGG